MNNKEQIKLAFKGRILGIRNYAHEKSEFSADDFTNLSVLHEFMGEVLTGESDITPAGKSFLDNYYGLKDVANLLFETSKSIPSSEFGMESDEKIHEWLENLVPMEVITFIETAKGNLKGGETLRPDLLPPENF